MQGKKWVFTHNNPIMIDHELHSQENWPGCTKGAFKYEKGESGTPHIQGMLIFESNKRLSWMKTICPVCHFEVMRGTEQEAFDYVNKEEIGLSPVYQWGGPFSELGKGARSDIAEAIEAYSKGGPKAACQAAPAAMAKYHRGIEYVVGHLKEPFKPMVLTTDTFYDWQKEVCEFLEINPGNRTIYWVTDTKGGRGKSALAQYLMIEKGAIMLEGKIADMAFQYNGEGIVCFDITRAQAEISDHLYSFAEKLKNGVVISTKYETKLKLFKPPHVIFFANRLPPAGVWSADRLVHFDLDD